MDQQQSGCPSSARTLRLRWAFAERTASPLPPPHAASLSNNPGSHVCLRDMGFKAAHVELSSCMAKPTPRTHKSWLPDANLPTADFPLTPLPYGAFAVEDQQHLCVAIGSHLLDLHACAEANLLPGNLKSV